MKTLLIALLTTLALSDIVAQQMSAMTYNIRFDNPSDGENNWHKRKKTLVNQLDFFAPDFLGIQEALVHQVKYLDEQLDQYDYLGVGRKDGKDEGEFSPLFYRKDRFEVLKNGTFWLSETPDVPSKGWDAALNRICTYALFEQKKSGKKIWVFNTHFDHKGTIARKESVKLIIQKVKQFSDSEDQVLVMGDFNLTPGAEPIKILSDEFLDARMCESCVVFGSNSTFNGFDPNAENEDQRIDYIFLSPKQTLVKKYAVFSDLIQKRFISDHFPVYIEFEIK